MLDSQPPWSSATPELSKSWSKNNRQRQWLSVPCNERSRNRTSGAVGVKPVVPSTARRSLARTGSFPELRAGQPLVRHPKSLLLTLGPSADNLCPKPQQDRRNHQRKHPFEFVHPSNLLDLLTACQSYTLTKRAQATWPSRKGKAARTRQRQPRPRFARWRSSDLARAMNSEGSTYLFGALLS